jgi:cytochrome c-type biogenesis protein CcmH
MILFWMIGAALAGIALLFVLRPLLSRGGGSTVSRSSANLAIYRDQLRELDADLAAGKLAQADYARSRAELEARLLEDVAEVAQPAPRRRGRIAAVAAGLAIPVCAVALYLLVGNPGAIVREGEEATNAHQVEGMVARLAARLRENPDDVDGWRLLGRSYTVLRRYPEAADAYAKAAARAPRDAQLLADFADVLAMARGQTLEGEPEKLVLRALEIDPKNLKALALAGTAAFERRDYAGAAQHWARMLPLVPPGTEDAGQIQANVEEARARAAAAGQKPPAQRQDAQKPAQREDAQKPAQTQQQAGLRGTVRISPSLKDQVKPDETVFIFARAEKGPPMPLAVLRAKVRELPLAFSLDDSMAMAPELKLSSFDRVVVTARVSKAGGATPQPGDLQGASTPVGNRANAVEVVIDTVVR